MSSSDAVLAQPDALKDWDRRVRRLAQDYAPKYRPLVLSLGYHVNLDEGLGRTYIKVETIVKESARYTASGKPLQMRYTKKLLAEMIRAGAVKAEVRYREDTGRQTSSYRTLNTSVSMDRNGFTRKHDFWAPFAQVGERKDTPEDTPQDTPQDTRTVFDLASDCQPTSSYLSPGAAGEVGRSHGQGKTHAPAGPRPAGEDSDSVSPWNVFYFWESRPGSWVVFCQAEADMTKVPGRATRVVLDGDETRYYFEHVRFQPREQRAAFLDISHGERLEYCQGYAEDSLTPRERAEREAAAAAEEERKRQVRAEREAALVECERLLPRYVAQWYTSDPESAHGAAVRETRSLKPTERLEHMRRAIARSEAYMDEDPEYGAEARPQIASFLERYADWSASRAA